MEIPACRGLRLRTVVLAGADILAIMLLDLLHRFRCILGAIVADRLGNGAIAILRDSLDSGQSGCAAARHAQDQER
jgi:hypothetical protein